MAKSRSRRLDEESGKNRVSSHRKRPPPPPISESEDNLSSDSDLESDLDMPAKDDSRRTKPHFPLPARKKGNKDGRSTAIHGTEDKVESVPAEKTENKVAPHMAILLAATYHVGISSISRPSVSSYIPSAANIFAMLDGLLSLVTQNTRLHELCPEFFSPVLLLYYSHVFYFQILRARSAAGSDVLTRIEKRAITYYERVGPAESWPIAAPLLGMFSFIAAHKTEDPMYGWIVPALPDFTRLNLRGQPNALGSMSAVPGIARVPLVPALQKILYNFAHSISTFEDGELLPVGQANLDATHTFCGLLSSESTNADFKTLAGNMAWISPLETGDSFGVWDYDIKSARIRRWNVPNVPDDANLDSLSTFLGFADDRSFDWMKHLLATSAIVNRFFPGSGNLSQVSPYTTIGMATQITYQRFPRAAPINNKWYYPRSGLTFGIHGYTNTESGLLDTKMAITCSPLSIYLDKHENRVSVAPVHTLSCELRGPFFLDDHIHTHERSATVVTENSSQIDPTRRFTELLTQYYDNRPGQS